MNENPNAYHCLPLVIANQWGWQVLCPTDVQVTWDGSLGPSGLTVAVDPGFALTIKSQFGSGIVTFSPPWLFRTAPGWDLYVKGPSNRWKANCVALEGVVETWWLNYTFTLNWKLIEPGTVHFAQGREPGPARARPARDVRLTHAPWRRPSATPSPEPRRSCCGGDKSGARSRINPATSTTSTGVRKVWRAISGTSPCRLSSPTDPRPGIGPPDEDGTEA